MLVHTPLVEAEQYGAIGIQDLTKMVMGRGCVGLAEKGLVPFEAARNIGDADNCPCPFHLMCSQKVKPDPHSPTIRSDTVTGRQATMWCNEASHQESIFKNHRSCRRFVIWLR